MANRIILQVAEAVSENESILRHFRKYGKNSTMDRNVLMRACSYNQKAIEVEIDILH